MSNENISIPKKEKATDVYVVVLDGVPWMTPSQNDILALCSAIYEIVVVTYTTYFFSQGLLVGRQEMYFNTVTDILHIGYSWTGVVHYENYPLGKVVKCMTAHSKMSWKSNMSRDRHVN